MTDTRDKLPSRPSSIGQAHRIIVQLKARVDELEEAHDQVVEVSIEISEQNRKRITTLEAQVEQYKMLVIKSAGRILNNANNEHVIFDLRDGHMRIADMVEKK